MAVQAGTPSSPALPAEPSALSRIYGFGSVFAKTIRDSRRAMIIVAAVLGLLLLAVSKAIVSEFTTVEARQQMADLIAAVPPILQGLAGRPIHVETLGGYVNYKYGTFFPLVASLWSILALSGTLATESRRGSMEFLAAAPISRRRIAIQKLAGHIVPLTIAIGFVFLALAVVGSSFAVLPGDAFGLETAAAYAIWLELLALVAGALAFAIAPFLGRGAAIGFASAVMFGGFILNGYQFAIPGLAPFANLTWFGWTTNHIPLAGQTDWPSLGIVAVVALVFFVIGVEAFVRRDLGATSAVPTPSLPRAIVGLRGPVGRAFGEAFATAAAWGIGIGLFGLVLAGSGNAFVEQLASSPDVMKLLSSVFPNANIASVGGFLELVFVQFGLVLAGLAAATLVAKWASDETSGRLEMVLATPLARRRWVTAGGLAMLIAIAFITALTGLGILLGALITGGDVVTPVAGVLVVGLYAAAMTGVGFAIGGIFGTGVAAAAVAIIVIVTWFIDIIAPALSLPEAIHGLALSAHYGQPMLGQWDGTGIVLSVVLAVAGVLVGAWGFGRRDLRG